jgi:glycosidase
MLTVTDNSGNTAEDEVVITVVETTAYVHDLRRDTIYSLVVSRFNNGDEENDFYNRERIERGDPHWRGDFQGLIEALDHIVDLGFTAVCLNQIAETRGGLDFEGTAAYDWRRTDPRLVSPDAGLHEFITAAKARGLRVILTVIPNQSSHFGIRDEVFVDRLPIKFYRQTGLTIPWPYVFNLGNYKHPFRMDNDNPRAPEWFQDFLHRDPWGAGPLIDPRTGTTLPKVNYRADRFFGTEEATLDDQWYHRAGWLNPAEYDLTTAFQTKHLATEALDLATENWRVKRYFIEILKRYRDLGVDGFRFDFAGNVARLDLLHIVRGVRETDPEAFFLADVVPHGNGLGALTNDGGPSELAPWWYARTGEDPRRPESGPPSELMVFDHPLHLALGQSIINGTTGGIDQLLAFDFAYGDPTRLITFFHHPWFGPGPDRTTRFAGATARAANAYTLLWTLRGIPCLTYGEEIEFQKGAPQAVEFTSLPLSRTGKAYFGGHLSGEALATTRSHPLYRHIQRLNLLRRRIPALQAGQISQGRNWGAGMSFIRSFEEGNSVAVVGFSPFIPQTITVDRVPPGQYSDAITGATQIVATDSRRLTFDVAADSAGIWVLNGPGRIGDEGPFLR